MSRAKEAFEACKEQYQREFQEDLVPEMLLPIITKIIQEKMAKFARMRIEHLNLVELRDLTNYVVGCEPKKRGRPPNAKKEENSG